MSYLTLRFHLHACLYYEMIITYIGGSPFFISEVEIRQALGAYSLLLQVVKKKDH